MELTILGTASTVPTKERNVQAFYLEYKGEGLLFDCGEGTQRQMNIAKINRMKVKKIFITHWHGDHTAGLIGLFQTIGNGLDKPEITLYGPEGTTEKMNHVMQSVDWEVSINLTIKELKDTNELKEAVNNEDYEVQYISLDHKSTCIGYKFIEKDKRKVNMKKIKDLGLEEGPWLRDLLEKKEVEVNGIKVKQEDATYVVEGKKLAIVSDTAFCNNIFPLVDQVDVAIVECTLMMDKLERADEIKHMTTKHVADIANQSTAKRVIATHFSQRYKDIGILEDELKDFAPQAEVAYDFMKVKF